MSEFENERIRGLPGPLPSGERILWRGSPHWRGLAWRAFHVREALIWFALIGAVRLIADLSAGTGAIQAIGNQSTLLPVGVFAICLLFGLAWLSARTTIYTITDRRIVLRIGIAMPLTVNVPHEKIGSAFLRVGADGSGDLGIAFADGTRLAWFVLWPHTRPWRVRHPEPMLRAIPDVARVADLLSAALAAGAGTGAFVRASAEPFVDKVGAGGGLPAGGIGAAT